MSAKSDEACKPAGDSTQAIRACVKSLEEDLGKAEDKFLRLAADFENFKKRNAQESDRRAKCSNMARPGSVRPRLRGVGLSQREEVRVRFPTSPAMDGFDGPSGTARILSDDCSRGVAGHGALPFVRTPPHCDKRPV